VAETGPGNVSAAIVATQAIEYFDPAVLFFSGIAGAVSAQTPIGSVVAATKVYSYESGKATRARESPEKPEAEVFKARPIVFPSSHRVTQLVSKVGRAWEESGGAPLELKPLAAGEALIASSGSELAKRLDLNYNDAIAVDMESAGIYQAAQYSDGLPCLAIRGISDHLDDKSAATDSRDQPLAAANAAAFLAFLLQRAQADEFVAQKHQ
jgi:8-oxo-dGTP diphosphatase